MQVTDVLFPEEHLKIKQECSYFLSIIDRPLITKLRDRGEFIRHKIRHQTKQSNNNILNKSVTDFYNIQGRSISVNTNTQNTDNGFVEYYIFPINGFKFIYKPHVTNITKFCNSSQLHLQNSGLNSDITPEVVRLALKTDDLNRALDTKSEILIYNIPYVYAVKRSCWPDYTKLLTTFK